jgi:O-antigen/teichoic acid export membrane protein
MTPSRLPRFSSDDRTLLVGASLGGLLRLLQAAFAAGLVVILTRGLPLPEYGLWASLGVVGTLVMIPAGIGTRLGNEMAAAGAAQGEEGRSRLFLSVFGLMALCCWSVGLLVLAFSPLIPWRLLLGRADPALFGLARRGFLLAFLIQLAGMPFVLASSALRAFRRNVVVSMLSPLATAGSLAIVVAFLKGPRRLPLLLAPFIAWSLTYFAGFLFLLRTRGWRLRLPPPAAAWRLFRPLVADGLSFSLLGFSLGFILQSLTFLTSRRLGYGAAGGLDVYVKVFWIAMAGFGEALQPLWPDYLRQRSAGDWAGLRRRFRSSLLAAAALSLAAAAGLALLAPRLVRWITGRTIAMPPPVLLLLGAWLLCGTLVQALQIFLTSCNAVRAQLAAAIALLFVLPWASGRLAAAWGRSGTVVAAVLCLALLILVMGWRSRAELARIGFPVDPARHGRL